MITWYGERGVVNAAVEYLVQKDLAADFLRCVRWADGSAPCWLEKVSDITFIVEPGLSDFGNPDLMLVCKSAVDPRPYCVFLEAKVIPYSASAVSNDEGMKTPGYNSGCNGQLSLKYRFARAMEGWDGRQNQIVEPEAIHRAYQRPAAQGGLGDPQTTPRKLQKPQILRKILAPRELSSLPLEHFGFVALTWDREPYFLTAPEYLPKFLDENGNDTFRSLSRQVGWLGYRQFEGVPGLLEVVSPALELMVGSLEPKVSDEETRTWPWLLPQPVEQMNPSLQELMRGLQQVCVSVFSHDAKFYRGSYSIQSASRVEAKIVPQEHGQDAFVMLGTRPEWPLQEWSGLETHGYKIQDQPFRFVRLAAGASDALAMAESILKQLREVLAGGHEPNA